MKNLSIIILFLVLSIPDVYSQYPVNYPFETFLDGSENLYVTGEEDENLSVYKYDKFGTLKVYKTYPNGGPGKGMDIISSPDGLYLYCAGYIYNDTTGNYDIIILKYYDDGVTLGTLIWHTEYDNASAEDKGFGITLDDNGNIYVCGSVKNLDMTTDCIVLKYNSAGTLLNSDRYPMTGNEVATDILTDNSYVYVAGYKDEPIMGISGSAVTKDAFLITYTKDLVSTPVKIIEIPGSNEIPTSFMITDTPDLTIPPTVSKVVMGGYQEKFLSMTTNANYFLAYYNRNSTGDQNVLDWSTDWGGTFNDYGTGITTDAFGNIVITGYSGNSNGNDDFATLKFDRTTHNIMWGPQIYNNNNSNGNERASSVFRYGSIYAVSGYSELSQTNSYITTKFAERSGGYQEVWENNYVPLYSAINNPQYYNKFATDTYVLSDSGIVTITYGWNDIASAYAVVKYDAAGNVAYTIEPSFDRPGYNPEMTDGKIIEHTFELKQNYPNPFNPTTVISFSLPAESYVTLRVYDLLGREIAELINGNQVSGSYSKQFDGSKLSSGIYIYKLTASNGNTRFEKTEKMILIK